MPAGTAFTSLKDKPVGGTKTGLAGCGLLGLAHKPIINFQFLQKPKFCAIIKAVVEKKMRARGPGQLQGKERHPRTPATAYDVKAWMQGLEGASNGGSK